MMDEVDLMKLDMKKGVSSETLAEMRNVDMRKVTLPVNGGTEYCIH